MAEKDLILIVVNNPAISESIEKQSLQAAGYKTEMAVDANQALELVGKLKPDAIIADRSLPGLSVKDLMLMLNAQYPDIPLILLVPKGDETGLVQFFRLGVADFLLWPAREAETLATVERVLKKVYERRERQALENQLQQTNQELQQRVRELTTISAIGKTVTSTTDQTILFDKILEGALQVTRGDLGWFLLKSDASKDYLLVSQKGLPDDLAEKIHKPWDDGISRLTIQTGKVLTAHGERLTHFSVFRLGKAILICPVKSQNQVIGLLVIMRRSEHAFSQNETKLLEAVSDYASISLANVRQFLAVEERLRALQKNSGQENEDNKTDLNLARQFNVEQGLAIESTMDILEKLSKVPAANWTREQRHTLVKLQEQVQNLIRLAESAANPGKEEKTARRPGGQG
jgi:two-component system NtrC family sensor kinase